MCSTRKRALAAALLALSAATADGADWTFTLPVSLSNLHEDVTNIQIICTTCKQGGVCAANVAAINWSATVGAGSKSLSRPTSGNLNQTVTLAFDAKQGQSPSDATRYTCGLTLKGAQSGWYSPSAANAPDDVRAKPGAPLTEVLSGTLP